MTASGRWHDLPARLASAAVLIGVGGAEVWIGGLGFAVVVCLATGAMLWELGRILGSRHAVLWGLLGATAVLNVTNAALAPPYLALHLAGLAAVFVIVFRSADRALRLRGIVYGGLIWAAGVALIWLRQDFGLVVILWLLGVVIASDIGGYFAGKMIGGPRFWPAISPNKTWAGTVAGWLGAALVGLVLLATGQGGVALLVLAPVLALAGQMGDIVESWFKRRAGIKDASRLIPGHGGVLDRFDALIFAALLAGCIGLAAPAVLRG